MHLAGRAGDSAVRVFGGGGVAVCGVRCRGPKSGLGFELVLSSGSWRSLLC